VATGPRARRGKSGSVMVLAGPPPAPEKHPRAEFESLPDGIRVRRIYCPAPYGTEALTFRSHGPVSRFDHHRRPNGFPGSGHDPDRGVLYAAWKLRCCLAEMFGDHGIVELDGYYAALLELTEPVRLLDLRGMGARKAGSMAAVYGDGNRETTQDWARYWYEHPDFHHCDGLLYPSAQTGEDDVVALWERAEKKVTCIGDWALDDPSILDEVIVAADDADLAMPRV
jgi:RES domain